MATLVVHIRGREDFDDGPREGRLYDLAREWERSIHATISSSVADHLGPEFQVAPLEMRPGSVEIFAPILTVGAALANYGAIRQGLQFVRDDIRQMMDGIFSRKQRVLVASYWELAPELASQTQDPRSRPRASVTPSDPSQGLVVYWMAITPLVTMAILASLLGVVFIKVL